MRVYDIQEKMNMDKQKEIIKQKIIENLEFYGITWDENQHKILVDNDDDFRKIQRKLAERTNLKGQKHKSEVEKYIAQPSDIDISKINIKILKINLNIKH